MRKHFFRMLLAFFLLSPVMQVSAQCEDISFVSSTGSNYTFSATTAQSYWWYIASGSGTISGSNTGQTVTVNATGTFQLCVVRFSNGNCSTCCLSYTPVCGLRIEEDPLNMCIDGTFPKFKKRGQFFLYDCNDSCIKADWVFVEGNSNFNWVVGPTNTCYINVVPNNIGIIGYVTVQAYSPGTSTLLASYVTQVYDCSTCTTCRTGNTTSTKKEEVRYLSDNRQIVFNSSKNQKINIQLTDVATGETIILYSSFAAMEGKNIVTLSDNSKLKRNSVYVVRVTTTENVYTTKLIY